MQENLEHNFNKKEEEWHMSSEDLEEYERERRVADSEIKIAEELVEEVHKKLGVKEGDNPRDKDCMDEFRKHDAEIGDLLNLLETFEEDGLMIAEFIREIVAKGKKADTEHMEVVKDFMVARRHLKKVVEKEHLGNKTNKN